MLNVIREYRNMVGDREFILELITLPLALIAIGITVTMIAALV